MLFRSLVLKDGEVFLEIMPGRRYGSGQSQGRPRRIYAAMARRAWRLNLEVYTGFAGVALPIDIGFASGSQKMQGFNGAWLWGRVRLVWRVNDENVAGKA